MCFHVVLIIHSIIFIFRLYRPQNNGTAMFNWISETIDGILTENPLASFHIPGDLNIHHKEMSTRTDEAGSHCKDFSIAYDLTQIIEEPTSVPDTTGHQVNILKLFLTSCREK